MCGLVGASPQVAEVGRAVGVAVEPMLPEVNVLSVACMTGWPLIDRELVAVSAEFHQGPLFCGEAGPGLRLGKDFAASGVIRSSSVWADVWLRQVEAEGVVALGAPA